MIKLYRFVGKRGRTTIPLPVRRMLNVGSGDLISYAVEDNCIVVRKEKVCSNCVGAYTSEDFVETLSAEERRNVLAYLIKKIREEKTHENSCS